MAKGHGKTLNIPPGPGNGRGPRDAFTTSKGITIKFKQPDHYLFQELLATREEINPPTYEVETYGGGKEVKTYDEKAVEETNTEEARSAWASYKANAARAGAAFAARLLTFMVLEGADIEAPEPDSDHEWVRRCKRYGIPIHADADDRKIQYVTTYCFGVEEDATDFMSAMFGFIAQEDTAAAALKATFRAAVQEARARRMSEARKRLVDIVGPA